MRPWRLSPHEIIAGVEGKFGRSGASTHPLPRRIREETVTTHSQRGGSGEHDLNESTEKDCSVRTRAGL